MHGGVFCKETATVKLEFSRFQLQKNLQRSGLWDFLKLFIAVMM